MNLWHLTLASLRFRWLTHIFNSVLLALGIAIILVLLQLGMQFESRFTRDLAGIDLVVGAKGSPLQLILSTVFHLDIPTGNIPLSEADRISALPLVRSAIPLALGDSYHGFRIVGTTKAYADHYGATLTGGQFFRNDMDAVLGSGVAQASHLAIGAQFTGSHGLTEGGEEHSAFPYTVTGILAPTGTVIDRLVLTGVGSVWNVHEHHHDAPGHHDDDDDSEPAGTGREITALLIHYKTPLAAASLPRLINRSSALEAASPAFETARLFALLGVGSETVWGFGALLGLLAGIGFFVTLYSSVEERRYDLALLRSLGATRMRLFCVVLAESVTLGVAGTALGFLLGHGLSALILAHLEHTRHLIFGGLLVHPLEPVIAVCALAISVAAAIIPAWRAYHINVAALLSRGR